MRNMTNKNYAFIPNDKKKTTPLIKLKFIDPKLFNGATETCYNDNVFNQCLGIIKNGRICTEPEWKWC